MSERIFVTHTVTTQMKVQDLYLVRSLLSLATSGSQGVQRLVTAQVMSMNYIRNMVCTLVFKRIFVEQSS
jgi:hypothetical protein